MLDVGNSEAANLEVVALAYDGLCNFEFGIASEIFGLSRPELDVDWYEFSVVAIEPGPLRTVGGLTLSASTELKTIETAGTIVLPGWRDPTEIPPAEVLEALRTAATNGARLMSICSGVFVLAATGLLNGQSATTHWRYTDLLAAMYPDISVQPNVLYVDNGSTLTSAGSAAGIDLGLHLIRRDFGVEVANQVARRLIVSPHREGGQAQFIETPIKHDDSASLAPSIAWAMDNLASPLTVTDFAKAASMSPRTFARRFRADIGVPPHKWLVQQRVGLARHLLESTRETIDRVAAESGFVTAQTLRHHFAREMKTTPTSYRNSFSLVK